MLYRRRRPIITRVLFSSGAAALVACGDQEEAAPSLSPSPHLDANQVQVAIAAVGTDHDQPPVVVAPIAQTATVDERGYTEDAAPVDGRQP